MHRRGLFVLGIALLLPALGCDLINALKDSTEDDPKRSKNPSKLVDGKPKKPSSTAERQPYIELNIGDPVNISTCFVRFTKPIAGRPSVLQVTTYASPREESFPSVYIRALDLGDTLEGALNKTFPATIYVARNPDSTVWHTPSGEPAEIRIVEVAAGFCTGQITSGHLVATTKDDRKVDITGGFEGPVNPEP